MASEASPTSSVHPLVSPSPVTKPQSFSKKLPSAPSMPKILGSWPDDDRQGEADDEALEHGLGDEAREEAQPEEAGGEGHDPGRDRERHGERDEVARSPAGELGDGRGREGRRGRHGPRDQVLRAAEGGVEDQGGRSRVETDHRRDAGDSGVGERLGHEHGPHREAREHVAAQPPGSVAAQRDEKRDLHGRRVAMITRRRPDSRLDYREPELERIEQRDQFLQRRRVRLDRDLSRAHLIREGLFAHDHPVERAARERDRRIRLLCGVPQQVIQRPVGELQYRPVPRVGKTRG